jgi:periplasmic copper chaperone A
LRLPARQAMGAAMKSWPIMAALALASCSGGKPGIEVSDGWTRATAAPGNAALYMTIANRGDGDDRLIEVSVPQARAAGLHAMSMEGGMMRMRPLDGLAIPAGGTARLTPGGTHVMVTGIAALVPGDRVEARLRFERSGERMVAIAVEPAGSR